MFKSLVLGGIAAATFLTSMPSWAQDQAQTPAPVCLRRADIDTFDAPNDYTVIVRTLNGAKYKLDLMGPCLDLKYRMRLGVKTVGGSFGLSCISRGDSIINNDREEDMRMNCPIKAITIYTPQQEAADKSAAAAKAATDNAQ